MIETKIVADNAPRTPRSSRLDSLFLSATIQRTGHSANPVPVRVRYLSAIGVMADFNDVASPGEAVVVTVRGIGAVAGTVTWINRGRIGINFDVEIDPLKARRPVVRRAPGRPL